MKVAQKSPNRQSPMGRQLGSKALHLAQSTLLDLGGPVALDILAKSFRKDWLGIVNADLDPSNYDSCEDFRRDYLAVSLLSKFPNFDTGIDLDAAAMQKFLLAESECAAASKRLGKRYVTGVRSSITPESILHLAREKIARVLGSFSWDSAESHFAFGPGATVSSPKRRGDAYYKFRGKPSVTHDCAILAYTAVHRVPRWYNHLVSLQELDQTVFEQLPLSERIDRLFDIVPGNRVCFVPKNAKTNRTIAIEPLMNGFLQHGIGSLIRHRLGRIGVGDGEYKIDLNDQVRNAELARRGSVSNDLATVDLSAASDSVSLKLCEVLLPEDWFEAICLTRSSQGVLPSGESLVYQKVSSMGNGYTFELESLIFWALSKAVVDSLCLRDRRVSVYGDDIILHKTAFHTLQWILRYVGFTVNAEKTFVCGPFRESCGKHYFNGTDVTPFYIRKDIASPDRLFWYANQIHLWSRLLWGLDGTLKSSHELCISMLPPALRKEYIPSGIGDCGIVVDFDTARPRSAVHRGPRKLGYPSGLEGYYIDVWLQVSKTMEFDDVPFLLRQLSSHAESGCSPESYLSGAALTYSEKAVGIVDNPSRVIRTGSTTWRRCKSLHIRE